MEISSMGKYKQNAAFNAANERMKYKYRIHIRRVGKKDEKTILAALKHIRDFEIFITFKGFETFDDVVADKYVQNMFDAKKSLSYITDNIRALKDFLNWLERQRGYRSKINYNHIDYLNISTNQRKEAKAMEYKKSYKFEQIIEVIRAMPDKTITDKRNRAIISLQALCALRVSELRTVKLKNLIEEDGAYFIYVYPKSMKTKFAKTRHVNFVPLPDDIQANVIECRDYLLSLGFKDADPLFPKIDNTFNSLNLLEQSIKKEEIKSDTTIREVFKKAFECAGLPYINPHSFRNTLARYAQDQSPAFLNAVRQNLGHSSLIQRLAAMGIFQWLNNGGLLGRQSFKD
jgi:integrase/recombinase XerD